MVQKMTADTQKTAEPGGLTYEEQYAVAQMRDTGKVISPDIHGGPMLWLGNLPVCTWPTLFSLLGRGMMRHYPTSNCYGLIPEQRSRRETDNAG
jgi:hypothetical protein